MPIASLAVEPGREKHMYRMRVVSITRVAVVAVAIVSCVAAASLPPNSKRCLQWDSDQRETLPDGGWISTHCFCTQIQGTYGSIGPCTQCGSYSQPEILPDGGQDPSRVRTGVRCFIGGMPSKEAAGCSTAGGGGFLLALVAACCFFARKPKRAP